MKWLLDLQPVFSCTIIALLAVTVSTLGVTQIRRRIPHDVLRENHELAAIIYNAFELLYAVLIAFVVFVTWTAYDSTQRNVAIEVNKLTDLFVDASAFPTATKQELRVAIADYTRLTVDQDWPSMIATGDSTIAIRSALKRVWYDYIGIDGRTISAPQMYGESLRQLNSMLENRRLRFLACRQSVPPIIWIILISGAIASTVYGFFFGSKHVGAQVAMTSLLSAFNAMILFLIYVLDNPFRGYSAISNEPFRTALAMFLRVLHG